MMGTPLALRARNAAQDLSEALAVGQNPMAGQPPGAPPMGAPPPSPPGGAPMGAPPMGAPPMGGASPNMPPRPPGALQGAAQAPSPLQGLPSFKSPPLAAFLQGPHGQTAQTSKPVGFAKGGLAMAKGGAWTRKEGKNPEGGLNAKGRASLKAEGHNIKPPVSAKQAAKSPKAAGRRKSFCARMSGMPGPMKDDKGRPTRKALSLRKWECK